MRDGMPGPGWWIASDGRWYPPELHPDMRATTAVVVEEPPAVTPSDEAISLLPNLPHGVSNGVAPALTKVGSTNGSPLATRETNGTTPLTGTTTIGRPEPARDTGKAGKRTDAIVTTGGPSRSGRQRLALAFGLALGTLALIIYLARGHDKRPSLESDAATNTTVASSAPTASVSPSVAPGATAATTTVAPGSAPSTVTTTRSVSSVTTAPTVTTTAKITPKVVSVFDLVKGNCLDGASLSDGLVTTIRVVDCTEVHTHEVYYSGRYPESTFDATKISNHANDTCLAQFAQYVGIDYTRSRYQYLHIVPTQESWTRDNDRDVVCVAFDEDSTIVGSIAGRAQ